MTFTEDLVAGLHTWFITAFTEPFVVGSFCLGQTYGLIRTRTQFTPEGASSHKPKNKIFLGDNWAFHHHLAGFFECNSSVCRSECMKLLGNYHPWLSLCLRVEGVLLESRAGIVSPFNCSACRALSVVIVALHPHYQWDQLAVNGGIEMRQSELLHYIGPVAYS